MSEMGYNKSISSASIASIPDIKIDSNIDLYEGKKAESSFKPTMYNSTDSTLDLSVFLTDNLDENCSAQAIAADEVRYYESYDNSTWYTDALDGLACAGATVLNGTMGFLEGVAEFGEGLIDTAAVVGGALISVPLVAADLTNYVGCAITGQEFNSATAAFWKDGVMPFVGMDLSGGAFDAIYSTDAMKAVDAAAVDSMKRGGTGYKIFKNIGYVSANVALGYAGGVSSLGATASQFSTAAAGFAKAGNTIESKYNKLSDEEKQDGGKIAQVIFNGALNGGLESATWYLTYGNGMDKVASHLTPGAKDFLGQTVFKISGNNVATKMIAKVFPNALKGSSLVKAGVQFLKPFASLGIDASTIGLKIDENTQLTDYVFNAFVDGLTNASVAVVYDASFLKNVVESASAKASTKISGKSDYSYKGHEGAVANKTELNSFSSDEVSQTVYKNLPEAISKYRYSPDNADFSQAQLTRILFEGMKKSGGNIVKKNISAPVKDGVTNIMNWGTAVIAAAYK